MKINGKLVLILIISVILAGCGKDEPEATAAENENNSDQTIAVPTQPEQQAQTQNEPAAAQANLPQAAPIKGVQWIKNGPVTIEKGKFYVIEFWATWCGPCKISIPHLTELQSQYKDKDVTIIGISTEEPSTVKPFVQAMGDQMDYTVAVDTEGLMYRNYMQAFGKQGIPQAFIVNQNSKIIWEGHPMGDLESVLNLVTQGDFDPVAYGKQKEEEARRQQQAMQWFMDYFQKVDTEGLTDEIKQIGNNFIENAPVDGLNAFAWRIMTRVQEPNRDLQAALKAAQKANQLTEGKDPSIIDTLALALFENGQVQEAIKTQQKAVDLTSNFPEAQQEFKERLQHYKEALGEEI